jgi:hypothetical protein
MHVNEDILNRAGIVLNFAAGLLLAPQVIGLDNIRRAEQWLDLRAWMLNRLIESRLPFLAERRYAAMRITYAVPLVLLGLVEGFRPFTAIGKFVLGITCLLTAVLFWLYPFTRIVRSTLQRHQGLIPILTAVGIGCFTIGNLVQFAATFHPGR